MGVKEATAGGWLDRTFRLRENKTTARTEVLAGLTTFMTMAYIIAVNPAILSRPPGGGAGPALHATVAATCLGAAIPTILMGLWTNYPLALASGMGLNAALVAAIGSGEGITWQTMMAVVFVEGCIIALLVLTRTREYVMNCIPIDLKRAFAVGIGLLIAVLGMHHAHWIGSTPGPGGLPLLTLPIGNFRAPETLLATFGLVLTLGLLVGRVRGALLIGIAFTTVLAFVTRQAAPPDHIVAMPDLSTFGRLDLASALQPALVTLVFAFLLTDFFDTMGSVIAVTGQSGHLNADGSLPRLKRVLLVDSFGAIWGGLCSASSVTTYIESASGVAEGGRTGLTSLVVGVMFLLAMFFSPLAAAVPSEATAAALIVVGFLMMQSVKDIDFGELTSALPAFLAIVVIPLTMSISRGIGTGLIAYALLNGLAGRARTVPPAVWVLAVLFAASFAMEGLK
jgi:AGZA family xanthine/uracil permease-like MFS transporter